MKTFNHFKTFGKYTANVQRDSEGVFCTVYLSSNPRYMSSLAYLHCNEELYHADDDGEPHFVSRGIIDRIQDWADSHGY